MSAKPYEKNILDVQYDAYMMRKFITEDLLRNFGMRQEVLDRFCERQTNQIKDPYQRERECSELRVRLIEILRNERAVVTRMASDISGHLAAANTVYPVYYDEYMDRRKELNMALKMCSRLQDELQYISETLPANKNKYTRVVNQIDLIYKKISNLRSSDNRLIPNLLDVPKDVLERHLSNHNKLTSG